MGGGRIFPSRVNCCIYVINHNPDPDFSGLVCLLISNFLSNREHRLLIQYLEVRNPLPHFLNFFISRIFVWLLTRQYSVFRLSVPLTDTIPLRIYADFYKITEGYTHYTNMSKN
jgi:hypothetical protein